ncbi:hypothetical protein [Stenotrophomonas sp. SrG]|uniref:hypothetical protein n=1 Tax=Stenotrophomonas sp. SrG TaxID=3414430 RepID=UPI003CF66C6C
MKMSGQAKRWTLLGARTISLVAFFYAQFKAVSTYKQLRECVEQVAQPVVIELCQNYPVSIEGYIYLIIASVLVLFIASHLLDKQI